MGSGAVSIGKSLHARDMLRIARLDQEEMLDSIGEFNAREVIAQTIQFFKSDFPVDWEKINYDENVRNQEAQTRIEDLEKGIIELFEVGGFLDTKVKNLSGGERTKLALFMVLASEPDQVLLY